MAGRARPAFIVLCRPGLTGEPGQTRMYGIGDRAYEIRAVLIEEAKPGRVGWAGPAYEFGERSRLIYRLHTYRGRKSETKAFTWNEYRDLLIAAHRQLPGGVIVLVWDNLNVHLHAQLRSFTSAQEWLRVFQLPSYAPDLNPVEGIWSVLKRGALANLAVTSFAHLIQVIRHGLKKSSTSPASSKAASPELG